MDSDMTLLINAAEALAQYQYKTLQALLSDIWTSI